MTKEERDDVARVVLNPNNTRALVHELHELRAMRDRARTAAEHAPSDTPAGHVARKILGRTL